MTFTPRAEKHPSPRLTVVNMSYTRQPHQAISLTVAVFLKRPFPRPSDFAGTDIGIQTATPPHTCELPTMINSYLVAAKAGTQ